MIDKDLLSDKLAETIFEWHASVDSILNKLSDDEVNQVLEICAKENDGVGSRLVEWDEIVDRAKFNLSYRESARKTETSGVGVYCVACEGECDFGEEHDRITNNMFTKTKNEIEVQGMSRSDLMTEVLKLREMQENNLLKKIFHKTQLASRSTPFYGWVVFLAAFACIQVPLGFYMTVNHVGGGLVLLTGAVVVLLLSYYFLESS